MRGIPTLRYIVQMVLAFVLPLLLQRWDRRHLSPDQRARAWNLASWGAALYAFGPFSMLGWGWVTRRKWWAPLAGLGCALAISLVVYGTDQALVAMLSGLDLMPKQIQSK